MTSPVRTYLAELHKIHAMGAGTDEVSLYNPLQNLLNEIGAKLKPKVFCIQNLKDLGAGFSDYGLYGANQLPKTDFGKLTPDIIAERGVIEAKAPSERVEIVADTDQVRDYWERYGLVLVTTFREFLIAGRDQFGRRENLEHFSLAETEEEFWALAARPATLPAELETRFTEFLTRVLLHNAPLTQPRDVALGLTFEEALACLGATTFDVHLNEEAYWANVPAKVWAYSIGGYQVMKKWLSYREYALLGRPLSAETARRLTTLRLLEPALDANYNAVRAETYPWPRAEQERA